MGRLFIEGPLAGSMADDDAQGPVFIGGMPRSGTTLFQSMLDYSPDLAVCRETQFFPTFAAPLATGLRIERWTRLVDRYIERMAPKLEAIAADREPWRKRLRAMRDLEAAAEAFQDLVATEVGDPPRWGEKTPLNALQAPTLLSLFPTARFVMLERDPRAVANSLADTPWGVQSLHAIARKWRLIHTIGQTMQEAAPDRFHVVPYEDLVTRPYPVMQKVCRFLGMPYDEDLVDRPEVVEKGPGKGIHRHVPTPPNPDRIDRWQEGLSSKEVRRLEAALQRPYPGLQPFRPPRVPAEAIIGSGTRHAVRMRPREILEWHYTRWTSLQALARWRKEARA